MRQDTEKHHVLIVGGGFAGLSAAVRLAQAGLTVRLLEKRPFLGGRAYSFREPRTQAIVDNGQHLLMGAYHETFDFLRSLGTLEGLHFQNNLEIHYSRGDENFFQLSCPSLPAPLHLALGLWRCAGLTWADKWAMLRLIRFFKNFSSKKESLDEISVQEVLERTHQTRNAIEVFWEPLTIATLNEPLSQASAQLFREVLQRGLLGSRADSALVVPRVGFSELYAEPARRFLEARGAELHFQTQMLSLEKLSDQWRIHTHTGQSFQSEYLLLALTPTALDKILESSDAALQSLAPHRKKFVPAPIVSLNLWYENFQIPQAFVGLVDRPIHWIFNKAKILGDAQNNYLSLVVSGAYEAATLEKSALVAMAHEELQKIYPQLRQQKPFHSQVIKEHEATFSGRVGLNTLRPSGRSPWRGLYLAGDWMNTELPATIESAVLSGHQAARFILEDMA